MNFGDPWGLDFYYIDTPKGSAAGHSGALIGNAEKGYDYYSFGKKSSSSGQKLTHKHYKTLAEARDDLLKLGYDRYVKYNANCETDDKARAVGESYKDASYSLWDNMCLDMVKKMMDASGHKYSDTASRSPRQFYDYLVTDNLGDSRGQIKDIPNE